MTIDTTWHFHQERYVTSPRPAGLLGRTFPSLAFYARAARIVFRSSAMARRGRYDYRAWARSSEAIAHALEAVGCRIYAEGLANLEALDRPCVFIGNHMSTLETFVLPAMIVPRAGDFTFVVKRSLTEYPVFKHVMRSRNPIVVDRVNPRDDLKAVMEQGGERLAAGYSIAIFPQHTRAVDFDPEQFNSIGIKLAARTGSPVIPIALQTAAWSHGKLFKDYGQIFPQRPIRFAFGAPFTVSGKGNEEHQRIIRFIQEHLDRWRQEAESGA